MSSEGRQGSPRRIAFVADELLGYAGNGIGTTTTFVSLALARMGHSVEILFAGPAPAGPVDPAWQRLYDNAGVRVRVVPKGKQRVEPRHFARTRDVEVALRRDPPDVVVVQDLGAPAYTALRLRRLGLAFEHTAFVVFCHGTRQWITDVSRKVRVLPGAQAVTVLERASVELADAVVSPSAYLVDWMRGQGWQLPEETFVIPHLSRAGATGLAPPASTPTQPEPVERVAFFGRLEERKGVRPFLAALNALEPELLEQLDVEFIGRPTPPWPVENVEGLLSEEARRALRGLTFETTLDQHEALDRLRRPGTLAIMPSFEENSPNTVYECLENRIPFIASDVAGIRELVAPEDRGRVLFEPTPEGIAGAVRCALADGQALRPARAAFDDAESVRRWQDVLALPARPFPPSGGASPVEVVVRTRADAAAPIEAEWVLLLDDEDVPEPALVKTLVRAQQVSGADVVSCGLHQEGSVHLFAGEPGALGLLSNDYGTVFLVRRSLLAVAGADAAWPSLAKLSVAGASIVSVPIPLVTSAAPPAGLHSHPTEALRVLNHFEGALSPNLRFLAELVTRAAAEPPGSPPPRARGLARRVARRLVRGRMR